MVAAIISAPGSREHTKHDTGRGAILQRVRARLSFSVISHYCRTRPGHGKANTAAAVSQSYNRNISLQTARWAIVDWLKDKHRDGIWGVRLRHDE